MPQYLTEFLEWLENYINHEALLHKYTSDDQVFSLDQIRGLAQRLGSPEKSTPAIHIAGSKGKGSVAKMLACILDEATGEPISIFASPHAYDFRERISTTRGFFPDEIYKKSMTELRQVVMRDNLTKISWYELAVALGFLCACEAKTKYSVIEVGCGGRLDATNIINPELAIINQIELEHTAILGDTLEEIAGEKAGIIKPGVPVIIGRQAKDSVTDVFREIVKKLNSPKYLLDEECIISEPKYSDSKMYVEVSGGRFQRPLKLELQMLGEKQAENAALAAVSAKILDPDLDESVIERGLARASLPGRFEQRGNVILDGAHTPASIAQTIEVMQAIYPDQKWNLIFGMTAGKDLARIVPLFKGRFKNIYITLPGSGKDPELSEITAVFDTNGISYQSNENATEIIQEALEKTPNDEKILAIGSFYLLEKVAEQL